jgi:putative addiction module component (TIGR02574 family)
MAQTISDEEIAAAEAESAVMQLSRARRAEIAARLIASLDDETPVKTAWAQEIRRRVSDYRAGRAKARPIDELLDEVAEILR